MDPRRYRRRDGGRFYWDIVRRRPVWPPTHLGDNWYGWSPVMWYQHVARRRAVEWQTRRNAQRTIMLAWRRYRRRKRLKRLFDHLRRTPLRR